MFVKNDTGRGCTTTQHTKKVVAKHQLSAAERQVNIQRELDNDRARIMAADRLRAKMIRDGLILA